MKATLNIRTASREYEMLGTEVKNFSVDELWDDRLIDDSKIFNVDSDPVTMHLRLVLLDEIAMLYTSGEIMCETGLRLKEKAPLRDLMIFSCFDGIGGYLVDKWGFENHTPSYYRNHAKDACAEEYILKNMLEMFEELLG
jgi:hypothetical protein